MKPVELLGNALDTLKAFPQSARHEAGFQLDKVQRGLDPDDWKPMKSIGPGIREIRVRDESGAFRVIYCATLPDAVYVLHCFRKKSQRTPRAELKLAQARFSQLMRSRS